MDFQQGLTLVISAASSLFGAGVTWGLLSGKVGALKEQMSELKEKAVLKETCTQCQSRWSARNDDLKAGMSEIKQMINQIWMFLSKREDN